MHKSRHSNGGGFYRISFDGCDSDYSCSVSDSYSTSCTILDASDTINRMGCGYEYSYRNAYFYAPNFSVSMYDETYNGTNYKSNDVWYSGYDYYGYNYYGYYDYYDYYGSAPGSHIPGGSIPGTPPGANVGIAAWSLNYTGNPNFAKYEYVDPEAILDEKCPKPPTPEPPAPAPPPETPTPPAAPVSDFDKSLDNFQTVLEVGGFVPGPVGTAADVTNGMIHLARGNFREAAWSFVGAIPIAGDYISGDRKAAKAAKAAEKTGDVAKTEVAALKKVNDGASNTHQALKPGEDALSQKKLASCFLAGTLVSRYSPDNIGQKELVPIEQIKFGDNVWAFNRTINRWEPRPVLDTCRRDYIGDVVAVNIGNEVIEATGGHPFWVLQGEDLKSRPLCECLPTCDQEITPQGRWVYARNLRIGDTVRSRLQETLKVIGLEATQTEALVYNFLVDDLHCYAVSENEILVHNNNGVGKYEDLDYKLRAREKNDKMKPSHARESKDLKAIRKENDINGDQKHDLHDEFKDMKGGRGNHTLTYSEMQQSARGLREK